MSTISELTKKMQPEILFQDVEVNEFESEEHALWYYRLLGLFVANPQWRKYEEVISFNRNAKLNEYYESMYELNGMSLELNFSYQIDGSIYQRFFEMLMDEFEDKVNQEAPIPKDMTFDELCMKATNFIVFELRKHKKL